jgi:methionyl-tRNA formyltransferase
MKLPIVFFGSYHYVLPIIEVLHKHFDLRLVVTTEQKSTDAVPSYCTKQDIPLLQITTLTSDEIESKLRTTDTPVAVVASFGLIIPTEIIDIFPKGIINLHPSFLPYYRGATPIQSAIKNGDTETAVSIMVIDQELDHGPLLSQLPLEISPEDTAESLYLKAFTLGAEKLIDVLPAYIAGNVEPREQDHSKATYTPRHLTRHDGFIDIANLPSKKELDQTIRAYFPWPGVWTKVKINGQEKILKLLPNQMFQMEGKKPVSKKDLLNGYPQLANQLNTIL